MDKIIDDAEARLIQDVRDWFNDTRRNVKDFPEDYAGSNVDDFQLWCLEHLHG